MTQSVGCLLKHEMSFQKIECFLFLLLNSKLETNPQEQKRQKHQQLMLCAINGPCRDLKRWALHKINSEMSRLPTCEVFDSIIVPFGVSAVCCRFQSFIFCALKNGTEIRSEERSVTDTFHSLIGWQLNPMVGPLQSNGAPTCVMNGNIYLVQRKQYVSNVVAYKSVSGL